MADIFEQAKESQAKTHAMIDNQRFQALTQPFDAGIEMSNEDMYTRWSQLPREDREWIGTNYGNKTGLSAGYYNRGAMDNFYNAYREQQAQAKTSAADAEKARIAERNAADDVYKASNGVEYNISRQFADDYKKYAGQYDYAAQQAATAQAVLKNEKATAEQKAAAQTKLDQAQADMKAAIGGIYTSMGSGVKVGDQTLGSSWADGTAPTTLDEIVALGRAGDAGIGGEMAYNEILRRAAERQDEVYKEPEQKSWEERYYEREAQRAALDRDNANRRLGMERLGRGIGELSAIIGDMVRASEGAPVTPRDWQKYYDALTAQEKANVNNYRIRMQKLAEDQRNLYLQRKAQDAAAAKDAADKQFTAGQKAADRKLQWDIANLKDKKDRYYAFLRWGQGGKDDKSKTHTLLLVGDKAILIPKGQSFLNAVNSLYDILNKKDNYVSGNARITITDNAELENDPQGFFNRNIQNVLSNYWSDLKPETQKLISKKLKQFQGEWVTGAPSYNDENVGYDPNDPTTWF